MLVYLLIVVNFQSWLDPFIIISALPAALAGIVWFLFVTKTNISVPALTGSIMCMGVATANSILVVSFAKEQMEEGKDALTAALAAGFTRFRPVLMTALAMIIGMVPMTIASAVIRTGRKRVNPEAIAGVKCILAFVHLFLGEAPPGCCWPWPRPYTHDRSGQGGDADAFCLGYKHPRSRPDRIYHVYGRGYGRPRPTYDLLEETDLLVFVGTVPGDVITDGFVCRQDWNKNNFLVTIDPSLRGRSGPVSRQILAKPDAFVRDSGQHRPARQGRSGRRGRPGCAPSSSPSPACRRRHPAPVPRRWTP